MTSSWLTELTPGILGAQEVSDLVAALTSHGVTVCLNAPDLR